MAPVDPSQLLKALNPLLGHKGEIKGPTEAVRIASLMKDAVKLVSRCIYISILKITEDNETMEKFLSVGGWDTLNDWLQDVKEEENYPVLVELLKVYQRVPVTVDILKTNNAAKTIKQLCKSENEDVKALADSIFEAWMKKVKGNNNNSDSKPKKKKKDKEREKDREKEREKEKDKEKSSSKSKELSEKDSERLKSKDTEKDSDKSKSKESKHSSNSSGSSRDQRESSRDSSSSSSSLKDKDTERDKRKEKEKSERVRRTSEDSTDSDSASDDVATVKQGSGLKLKIKLGSDKPESGEKEKKSGLYTSDFLKSDKSDTHALMNDSKKRASTVKRPPSKFRSTGLEEESMPPPKIKPPVSTEPSKPSVPKRPTGSEDKSEPPLKKSRLHVNMPPPSLPSSSTVTTPTQSSPTSPGEIHGKIKLIPARPRPNHEIHESTGFMDSLERTTARTYGQFKKKKKAAAAVLAAGGQKSPTTPPSPVSPITAVARTLPAVPSFYKDTLQDEPSPDKKEVKKERSPSPEEEDAGEKEADKTEETAVKEEIKTETDIKMETESDTDDTMTSTESALEKEAKGLLTTGATKKKKHKKTVSWKEEGELHEIFYFELDEDERENVNRPKDFNLAKKHEMMMDRKAMESGRRLINDLMTEQIAWYRPKVVAGMKLFETGKESQEKEIQKVREQGVLQALFFDKNMLPGTPAEPELEHEVVMEPKIIPLEDSSGGEEFLYNYEEHAQAVPPNQSFTDNLTPTSIAPGVMSPPRLQPPMGPPGPIRPPQGMMQPPNSLGPPPGPMMPPGPMGPGFNIPQGLNLPPDVADLLNMLQSKAMNPDDPLMQNVQQILSNIMGGGSEQSYEQLQQIMNQQMGAPPGMLQGPPPGPPPPMGPGGPRMGLLGNAPPGFMPQRPPMGPPHGFGPPVSGPGPGPNNPNWGQQNMGGMGPNMGMPGGPLPNQGFNQQQQFRGRMPGPGQQGRGGPHGGGPPPRNKGGRVVCRHFLAPTGCRRGDACGFLHVRQDKNKKDGSKKSRWTDGPPKLDGPVSSPPPLLFDGPPPKLKQETKREPNSSPLNYDGPPKLKQESNMSPPR